MNSFLKGILHTLLPVAAIWVTSWVAHSGFADMTIGSGVGLVLNWLLSHFIPTTTGASARQA